MFSYEFCELSQSTFSQNTSGRLLLKMGTSILFLDWQINGNLKIMSKFMLSKITEA